METGTVQIPLITKFKKSVIPVIKSTRFLSPRIKKRDATFHNKIILTSPTKPDSSYQTISHRKEISCFSPSAKIIIPNFHQAKHSNHSSLVIKGFAANTTQGLIRPYNEDRVAITLNLKKGDYAKNVIYWPNVSIFSIFDGHGGNGCADYLKNALPNFIAKSKYLLDNTKEAIEAGFLQAETYFAILADSKNKYDFSGSCALTIIIIGNILSRDNICYIANVGDSRAILSSHKGEKYMQLTTDHKPNNERERIRILGNGGRIYQCVNKQE